MIRTLRLKPLIAFLEGNVPEEHGQPRFKERMATLRRRTDDYVIDPDDGLLKYKGQLGASNVDRPLIVVPRRQRATTDRWVVCTNRVTWSLPPSGPRTGGVRWRGMCSDTSGGTWPVENGTRCFSPSSLPKTKTE